MGFFLSTAVAIHALIVELGHGQEAKITRLEIEVPAAQLKLTGYAPTVTVSSSAAAVMEVASTATEQEKVRQTDRMLSGLDDAILTALVAEPSWPLAVELNLPDLSPAVIRSLAESNKAKNQKTDGREANFVDHLKKGGITAGIAYLKSLIA